jgi:serine phosphatase RsbU (regulator of sigma subunit)
VVDLPPGAVLACFTDGLVERRREVIDVGIEQLLDVVRPAPAEEVCATVMGALATEQPTDDIALLVVRRRPTHG